MWKASVVCYEIQNKQGLFKLILLLIPSFNTLFHGSGVSKHAQMHGVEPKDCMSYRILETVAPGAEAYEEQKWIERRGGVDNLINQKR